MTTRRPITLFSSKHLAPALGVNLARWKRWVRDFLPPDPLAGRQAGYARQFYVNDAFQVFLAGILVGELHFSVPEARTILADLNGYLPDIGYRLDPSGSPLTHSVRYQLDIRKDGKGRLCCRLTGDDSGTAPCIGFGTGDPEDPAAGLAVRTLRLTACLKRFLVLVDPERTAFSRLHASLPAGSGWAGGSLR